MSDPATLGQRIRQRRLTLGLSQQELASRVRITQSWVSQIEHGRADGSLPERTLSDLADALNSSPADLVGDDPRYDLFDVRFRPAATVMPVPGRPLIGRTESLAEIEKLVLGDQVRLLTLTGPGGVGKTHLALAATAALGNAFSGGAASVSLVPCGDAAQIVAAIAHAIGLPQRDTQGTQGTQGRRPLLDRLVDDLGAERRLLLTRQRRAPRAGGGIAGGGPTRGLPNPGDPGHQPSSAPSPR